MWLDLLVSALFGILEGVTEWLPISSTGHLILLSRVVKFPARDAFFSLFEVVIQLAAILAVLLYYRERLNPLSAKKTAAERSATWRLWGLVLLATLPAAILGLLLGDLLECYLYRIPVVAAALILYGVAFLLLERWRTRHPLSARTPLPGKRQALWIGCFQALALIPGTSRSGSTVIGGLCTGLTREGAAEFSFFLAIPTMLGAGALKTLNFFLDGNLLTKTELALLAAGSLAAFLTSLLVVRMLLDVVRRHGFSGFGIYRILLGIAALLTLI